MSFVSHHKVYSDDGAWILVYESDIDGPLPHEWLYDGKVFPYDPPTTIRRELEDRAWKAFHEGNTE